MDCVAGSTGHQLVSCSVDVGIRTSRYCIEHGRIGEWWMRNCLYLAFTPALKDRKTDREQESVIFNPLYSVTSLEFNHSFRAQENRRINQYCSYGGKNKNVPTDQPMFFSGHVEKSITLSPSQQPRAICHFPAYRQRLYRWKTWRESKNLPPEHKLSHVWAS